MAIKFKHVDHEYAPNSPFEFTALKDVSASIAEGRITAIIGATGSGKSTFVQHLNGLLKPTAGSVECLGTIMTADQKVKGLKALRAKVGLVFQFPEMQLFEETIYKDVAFGPKNFGFTEDEVSQQVEQALTMVGIAKDLWERSPFDLSGGQKRRVAIAGVLATNPDVLVLDEPTAGLDPQGSKAMMDLFVRLNRDYHKTIIMVTHNMDHVLHYCEDVLVLDKGSVFYEGTTRKFFETPAMLKRLGFVEPSIMTLKRMLFERGCDTGDSLDLDVIAGKVKEVMHRE